MRILVTTAGTETYHYAQRDYFRSLAVADEVGEHELVDDLLDADGALFVDLQQHPGDTFLRALRRHPLVRRHPEKVYVYDERDFPFVTLPGIYVGATPSMARRHPVVGGPYPALPTSTRPDAHAPDLLFSFSGAVTHPVRRAVLALDSERCFLRDTTAINFFGWVEGSADDRRAAARREFEATIARSKFVLCPRGHSPSSFRLYETLSAGRVPVVISDSWLAPPRADWDACVIQVRERDVSTIPTLLEQLEPKWPEMAAAAERTWANHFSPPRLWHHYASSIAQLGSAHRHRPWWAQGQVLRLTARSVRGAASRSLSR